MDTHEQPPRILLNVLVEDSVSHASVAGKTENAAQPIIPPDLRETPRRPVNSDVEAVEKTLATPPLPYAVVMIAHRLSGALRCRDSRRPTTA